MSNYPPADHPAWQVFARNDMGHIPHIPGTYWYDNCWGSYSEPAEPMQITIDRHPDGMQITAINGEPEDTGRAMHGYQGLWAPLNWEGIKRVDNEVIEVEAAPTFGN